jgi:hypothetical protein
LFTRVTLETHWIHTVQFVAVFGQKIELGLQSRHPSFDGTGLQVGVMLLIHKGIDIVHRDLTPGFRTARSKLADIAQVIDRRSAVRKAPL